jgi:ribosome maturation protein SDO1
MAQVIARIRVGSKHFEILVEAEEALKFKKTGEGDVGSMLDADIIFTDSKKGLKASSSDLEEAFGTSDVNEVASQIIKRGEVQIPQDVREAQRGERFKQVVDFLVKNAINAQTNGPFTPERIERGLDEIGANIQNKPIESQIKGIVSELGKVLPIKIETKSLKITIPAQYTGQAYGVVNVYKESEEWKDNGELEVMVSVPVGMQMEFYDKLNAATHGSAVSEEVEEKEE